MLIPFLDLEIKLDVILTHKIRSRLRCRGQIPEKRSAVLFFSQKQKLNQHPPKPPKRLLKHIWDVLWRNIRDFFWQNGPQNGKIEKIEKSKLLKNCTLKWKITLESVIRDPSWVQISCNTSCNFLRFFCSPVLFLTRFCMKPYNHQRK